MNVFFKNWIQLIINVLDDVKIKMYYLIIKFIIYPNPKPKFKTINYEYDMLLLD